MASFSQQASELHFHSDPLPMAPTCSKQFYVNRMQQGIIEVATWSPQQPQYEAASDIVLKNAATGPQSILNTLQRQPPVSTTSPQIVQSVNQSPACYFEPGGIQVLPDSEHFYVNQMKQGLIEVPTSTLDQPQYETASNIMWNNAVTGPQSILFNAFQSQPPFSAMACKNVQNPIEGAACGVEPRHFQAVPDTQPPASTWSQTVQKSFLCNLCDYIGASEEHWHAHAEAHRLSACNVRAKQVKRESLAAHRKTAAPSGPRTPKRFKCTYCPKTYVREVYYRLHVQTHIKAFQESGLNARKPGLDAVAVVSAAQIPVPAMPAPVLFDPVAFPSSTVSKASPIAASVAASTVAGSLTATEFPPPAESQFHQDALDVSKASVFPSEVAKENFEQLWDAMIYDIIVSHFTDSGD